MSLILFICSKKRNQKRAGGYKNYLRLIRKFQKNRIWYALSKKISLEELKALSVTFSIPESTIRSWQSNLILNPNWLPCHIRTPILPITVENVIAELILEIYESHNEPITDLLVKKIASIYHAHLIINYDEKTLADNSIPLKFFATKKWISGFKARYNFSRRRYHYKRRPNIDTNKVQEFKHLSAILYSIFGRDRLLNVDETFWRLLERGSYTWAPKGSENISINSTDNEKSGFTTVGTISCEGAMFPLVVISSGLTERSESNWFGKGHSINNEERNPEKLTNPLFGSSCTRNKSEPTFIPQSLTDHSPSGWTNLRTWLNYIFAIRYEWLPVDSFENYYTISNTVVLFADAYPVHHSKAAKEFARLLNIYLVKIPEGLTDMFQPLDNMVFGIMKSEARSYLNARRACRILDLFDVNEGCFKDKIQPQEPLTKKEALFYLEHIWNRWIKIK